MDSSRDVRFQSDILSVNKSPENPRQLDLQAGRQAGRQGRARSTHAGIFLFRFH